MKRIVSILLTVLLTVGVCNTVKAAPKTMKNGDIFDAEVYAALYPDVVAAYGKNESKLYNHYKKYGKREGRIAYIPGTEQVVQQNTVAIANESNNIAFNGEKIIRRGTSVMGYDCILSQKNYNGFSVDDCFQTSSGVYVRSGSYICKFFDSKGDGTPGQYVLWGISFNEPLKYANGPVPPILGVHYWIYQ